MSLLRKRRASSDDQVSAQVVFWVGGRALGLPIAMVREVVEVTELVPVPDTVSFVVGLTSLRGAIMAVIDAERLLFETPTESVKKMLVLVRDEQVIAGLTVDRVEGVFTLGRASKLAGTPTERFLTEAHDLELGTLVSLIDVPAVLHHIDASRSSSHPLEVAE